MNDVSEATSYIGITFLMIYVDAQLNVRSASKFDICTSGVHL